MIGKIAHLENQMESTMPFRNCRIIFAAALFLAGSPFLSSASAQRAKFSGPARSAIQQYLKSQPDNFARRLLRVNILYGDFTGDGRDDAIAFMYAEREGGNSVELIVASFARAGLHFRFHRRHDEVEGESPADAMFTSGRIVLTTKVPLPDDARCCPTGQKRWTIKTD